MAIYYLIPTLLPTDKKLCFELHEPLVSVSFNCLLVPHTTSLFTTYYYLIPTLLPIGKKRCLYLHEPLVSLSFTTYYYLTPPSIGTLSSAGSTGTSRSLPSFTTLYHSP